MTPDDSRPSTVHLPVLLHEVLEGLNLKPGSVIVDATVGAGGHARAIAQAIGPDGHVIGLDRDPEMLALAEQATEGLPVSLFQRPYSDLLAVLDDLEIDHVDGILLDLGLSSDQLAWTHRGFSFSLDGPLDMRFSPKTKESAADMINGLSETELADLFFQFGEERHSRRIARRIVEARRVEPIQTTGRLADLVRKSIPGKWGAIDPATRVFQALRIAVNDEMAHLDFLLPLLPEALKDGGRVAIISFHSLEDRRIKHAFRDFEEFHAMTRKPITATAEESQTNPRARSAKLRVAERCKRLTDSSIPRP